jgi:hypothetical protein
VLTKDSILRKHLFNEVVPQGIDRLLEDFS